MVADRRMCISPPAGQEQPSALANLVWKSSVKELGGGNAGVGNAGVILPVGAGRAVLAESTAPCEGTSRTACHS